jgi:uncharacterized membrane protein
MPKPTITPLAIIALAGGATLCGARHAHAGPPTILNLGVLAGGFQSNAFDVSNPTSSGTPVVTGQSIAPGGPRAIVWADNTLTEIHPFAGGGLPAAGLAVSADGLTVVGYCTPGGIPNGQERATRWTRQGGTWVAQNLGTLPDGAGHSGADDVTNEGQTVVGSSPSPSGPRAVLWTFDPFEVESLGVMEGGTYTFGTAISADGSAVAGEGDTPQGQRAFRWTRETGCVSVGAFQGGSYTFASDLSADGRITVGVGNTVDGQRAFRHDAETGELRNLGTVGGARNVIANATNADGSVIIGTADSNSFYWTEQTGILNLSDHLVTLDVDLTGWQLDRADAISPDGSAIAGTGRFNGQTRGFVISGLPSCGPTIEAHGGTIRACEGGTASFFVTVAPSDSPVRYVWRLGGIPIDPAVNPSAATERLELTSVSQQDVGVYDCVISNACGATSSPEYELTLLPPDDPECGNPPCPADIDQNGTVNSADFFAFLVLFFGGVADFNGDGATNSQDFFDYLNEFFNGMC